MGRGTAKGGLPARSPGGFNDPPCEVQKNLKVRHGILHAVIRSRQDAPESTRTPTLLNEQGNHSFNHNLRGFGYRHCYLHVPFTFWNEIDRTFWDPHQSQKIVDTTDIWNHKHRHRVSTYVHIQALHSPCPIPCTVSAALVHPVPPNMNVELISSFTSRPYGDQKKDVLDSKLPLLECVEIKIPLLKLICGPFNFLLPPIIAELAMRNTHARHSLPGCTGNINIVYHDSPTSY